MTMNNPFFAFITFAVFLLLLSQPSFAGIVLYQDIAPILKKRCVLCHNGPAASNGFRMETYQDLMKGGKNGAMIVPGDTHNSKLYQRIKGITQPRMPLTGFPLSNEQIQLIADWINQGALETIAADNQGSADALPVTPDAKQDQSKPATPANPDELTYNDVSPILMMRCMKCHSPNGVMGPAPENYLLDSYQNTMSANDRVRIVSGNAAASELVRRIRGLSMPRMPFDGPPYLNEEEIRLIENWIGQGARDEQGIKAAIPAGAKIRLHGRLTDRWNLDGNLPFSITGNTRLKKAPGPGDYVELRGRVDSKGNIIAERLRRRD